jgi:hypothetical protein
MRKGVQVEIRAGVGVRLTSKVNSDSADLGHDADMRQANGAKALAKPPVSVCWVLLSRRRDR